MSLGLWGRVMFSSQEDRKNETLVLENTNDHAGVVLLVAKHGPPHLSRTGLSCRFEIPTSSSIVVFPYNFLEVHAAYRSANAAVSAHVFFQSDSSRPESWTSLCPSLFLSCHKLIFGRDGETVSFRSLERPSGNETENLADKVRIPFHIHNTRDIAGESSLFALSTYLHSASHLSTPTRCFSPDPFLKRRGIKIAVGSDGNKLNLEVLREENYCDEEVDNGWEELRFWHIMNHTILEIAQDFIFSSEERALSDEDVLAAVSKGLLKLHGFEVLSPATEEEEEAP